MDTDLIVKLAVGICGPGFGAWALVRVAQIRASRPNPIEQQKANSESDRVSLEAFRDFRAWAEARIEWQDRRIGVLENALTKVSEKYTLMKEAFREFYREVRSVLGTATPVLDEHVRRLLTEQDLDDTFNSDTMQRLREENPPPPPPPPV